jgi:hypothetical protein
MHDEKDLHLRRRFLRGLTAAFAAIPVLVRGGSGSSAMTEPNKTQPVTLPFEYEIVAGKDAEARLTTLAAQGRYVPVVLGAPERLPTLATLLASQGSFAEVEKDGLSLDVDKWIADTRSNDPEYFEANGPQSPSAPVVELTSVRDVLTGTYFPKVAIALCRVSHPWEVAAVLRPGGWNECPDASVHFAFFKRWHERYGAVPAAITDDVIEFTVARPPQTADDAMSLAQEQFVYCADIVHQGVQSVSTLASLLRGGGRWFFWWD